MKLRTVVAIVVLARMSPSMMGCATILGGGANQPVSVSSSPSGAHYTIKSSSGIQMADGAAPATVLLPRKNEYQVTVTMDGYRPQVLALTKGVNGWIWGNLFIGWIVGFIVDFASGSGYKLEPAVVSVTLETAMLPDGSTTTFAVARLLTEDGRILEEQRAPLVPQASTDAAEVSRAAR